jgi:hypothetical protein
MNRKFQYVRITYFSATALIKRISGQTNNELFVPVVGGSIDSMFILYGPRQCETSYRSAKYFDDWCDEGGNDEFVEFDAQQSSDL